VTPLGATWEASVAELARGRTAVAKVASFDVEGFPCRVAAAIADRFGDAEDRRFALASCVLEQLWQPSMAPADPSRLGVFIGAESGRARFDTVLGLARAAGGGDRFDHAQFGQKARALAARLDASVISPATVASFLAGRVGALGPALTFSLACSSGLAAIVEAARAVGQGEVDVALCGGVGADVDPLMLAGFGLLGILSARGVSCPFDARRDGFVVGEGAALVVLTADPRGARAVVAGVARTLDAHHLTAPHPDGDGAFRAMSRALAQAGDPAVDYVQAHGTSTPHNDAIESQAIRRALGARLDQASVGAVKGALGHWVAGAGAVGFLCALEAVEHGLCLPTAGLERPADDCPLPHVIGAAVQKPVVHALVNAFAFGGANSSVVLRAP
jgi:3-oxoacyl-[acyl-carrier-protein] synthase II